MWASQFHRGTCCFPGPAWRRANTFLGNHLLNGLVSWKHKSLSFPRWLESLGSSYQLRYETESLVFPEINLGFCYLHPQMAYRGSILSPQEECSEQSQQVLPPPFCLARLLLRKPSFGIKRDLVTLQLRSLSNSHCSLKLLTTSQE